MESRIFIPTYARTRVLTYENLSELKKQAVTLVVMPQDAQRLSDLYPGVDIWICYSQGRGAVGVKNAILHRSKQLGESVCIIFDDDLAFEEGFIREGKKRFRKASTQSIYDGIEDCYQAATRSDIGFSYLGSHFFNASEEKWIENRKGAWALFINNAAVLKSKAKFEGPTMSDVYFMLSLATAGYGSLGHSWLVVDDVSKSGVGGESAIADRGGRAEQAIDLMTAKWPEYVKVRDASANVRHRENFGLKRDITVYFAKAVKDGKRRREEKTSNIPSEGVGMSKTTKNGRPKGKK